jgi:hypothetical protein
MEFNYVRIGLILSIQIVIINNFRHLHDTHPYLLDIMRSIYYEQRNKRNFIISKA